ncbi:MAG: hypothetical protein LT106_18595 [Burkholderiaceae bacterium]|nr:hypothetical protein [Burkholderiaceae bacterium]
MDENDATNPDTGVAYSEEDAAQDLLDRWNGKRDTADAGTGEQDDQAGEAAATDETQADEAQAETKDEATDADTEWEVEFGGQVRKLPKGIPEAVAKEVQEFGQSLHADYTRKTQEVAQQRQRAEADAQSAAELLKLTHEHADLIADFRMVQRQIESLSQQDLAALSETDPLRAQQQMLRLMQLRDAQQKIGAQLQTTIQSMTTQQTQAAQQRLAEANAVLSREIKDWSPDTSKALTQYARSLGFSDSELSQVSDARVVLLLHKAQQFDALKSSAASTVKRVSTPAKTLKTAAAGTTQSINKASADDAMKRLSRTGTVADAAAALLARARTRK